jgi:hypothetical protein
MTTNQLPYEGGMCGEIVVDRTPEEAVIPTQRGALDNQPAAPKDGEQKPFPPPWTRDRAEFISRARDVGKRPQLLAIGSNACL